VNQRATDSERRDRECHALQLLSEGHGSASTALTLSQCYGVSLRQARRYVQAASFDLCEVCTPAELDRQGMLSLYRLDLIAGRAMEADPDLAVRATRAHAAALAQFRRAITAPAGTRFRLPDTRDAPIDPDPDTDSLPF
jgi:hypothetical protein